MKQQSRRKRLTYIRTSIYLILGVLFIWLLVRQRHSLSQALDAIAQADLGWLSIGLAAMLASLPATALVYRALSPKPLRFARTVVVQTAGFCVNKLLPSGSGAAGVSFLYLRAHKVPGVQAGAVVVLNNLLGFVGHLVLFWLLIALEPAALKQLRVDDDTLRTALGLVGAGFVMVVGLVIVMREKVRRFAKPLGAIARPAKLLRALAASMLITLCYVVSLLASAQAVGVDLSLATAIIVLSTSVLATAVVPTPGGIGAAEAGAYTGLIALGVDMKHALATAILFRVCTFWMPLLVGSGAFIYVAKRGYLKAKT